MNVQMIEECYWCLRRSIVDRFNGVTFDIFIFCIVIMIWWFGALSTGALLMRWFITCSATLCNCWSGCIGEKCADVLLLFFKTMHQHRNWSMARWTYLCFFPVGLSLEPSCKFSNKSVMEMVLLELLMLLLGVAGTSATMVKNVIKEGTSKEMLEGYITCYVS